MNQVALPWEIPSPDSPLFVQALNYALERGMILDEWIVNLFETAERYAFEAADGVAPNNRLVRSIANKLVDSLSILLEERIPLNRNLAACADYITEHELSVLVDQAGDCLVRRAQVARDMCDDLVGGQLTSQARLLGADIVANAMFGDQLERVSDLSDPLPWSEVAPEISAVRRLHLEASLLAELRFQPQDARLVHENALDMLIETLAVAIGLYDEPRVLELADVIRFRDEHVDADGIKPGTCSRIRAWFSSVRLRSIKDPSWWMRQLEGGLKELNDLLTSESSFPEASYRVRLLLSDSLYYDGVEAFELENEGEDIEDFALTGSPKEDNRLRLQQAIRGRPRQVAGQLRVELTALEEDLIRQILAKVEVRKLAELLSQLGFIFDPAVGDLHVVVPKADNALLWLRRSDRERYLALCQIFVDNQWTMYNVNTDWEQPEIVMPPGDDPDLDEVMSED